MIFFKIIPGPSGLSETSLRDKLAELFNLVYSARKVTVLIFFSPIFRIVLKLIWKIDYEYKQLIKKIDILGKETTNKGFNIEIYDDGSVQKKYVIE